MHHSSSETVSLTRSASEGSDTREIVGRQFRAELTKPPDEWKQCRERGPQEMDCRRFGRGSHLRNMRSMRSMDAHDALGGLKGSVATQLMSVGGRSTIDVRGIVTRNEVAQKPPPGVPKSATFCATCQTAAFGVNDYMVERSVFGTTSICDVALGARKVPQKVPFH
jgi:hypothetical protein